MNPDYSLADWVSYRGTLSSTLRYQRRRVSDRGWSNRMTSWGKAKIM
jgi:hypothetical protein